MNLSNLHMVAAAAEKRAEILAQIKGLENYTGRGYLGVTLQSNYQDDEMCDAVRPAVIEELKRRVAVLSVDLKAMGVELNES